MLGWRLTISAFLIPALVGLFVWDTHLGSTAPILMILTFLLLIRANWELHQLVKVRNFRSSFLVTTICILCCAGSAWVLPLCSSMGFQLPFEVSSQSLGPVSSSNHFGTPTTSVLSLGIACGVLALSFLVLFFQTALRFEQPGISLETLGIETVQVLYLGLLTHFALQLRWVAGSQAGYLVLGSLIVATKGGDIGAYTLGRLIGKRKMCPRLSPGKTWAGAVGALVGSAILSAIWFHFMTPNIMGTANSPQLLWCVCYGMLLGMVGLIGDLCESLMKRDVEKKDAANLMPGFGGLLDLLDSIFYAAPIAWLLWILLPLRTW